MDEELEDTPEQIQLVVEATNQATELVNKWTDNGVTPPNMILLTQVMSTVIYNLFADCPSFEEFKLVNDHNLQRVYDRSQAMVERALFKHLKPYH